MITVAICTWNRAATLDACLNRLATAAPLVHGEHEVLVVDNNSTDHTAAVVDRFRDRLPIRRVLETRQGIAHARNRAASEASGEWLFFIDDDVLVTPEWFARYQLALREYPHADFFGGPIEPLFETDPPRWLHRFHAVWPLLFGLIDYGPEIRPIQGRETCFGANMAFRTSLLRARRFDDRLGHAAGVLILGEETALVSALREAGSQGVWVGGARVGHMVPGCYLTRSYFRRRLVGCGRTTARIERLPADRLVFGLPLWLVRRYVQAVLTKTALSPVRNDRWAAACSTSLISRGMLSEWRKQRDGGTPPLVA